MCPSRGQTVPTTVSRARGVADEVRHIRPGDFFVLRNAVHGTVSAEGGPIAWLARAHHLVPRCLAERVVTVEHLLADRRQESHAVSEDKLLAASENGAPDLFTTAEDRAQRLARAWQAREEARLNDFAVGLFSAQE